VIPLPRGRSFLDCALSPESSALGVSVTGPVLPVAMRDGTIQGGWLASDQDECCHGDGLLSSRVLVLGGGGFIGSHVVTAAAKCGYSVRVFDRQASALGELPPSVEVVVGDWYDHSALAAALVGCDTVIHLISCSVPADAFPLSQEVTSNVLPTLGLLEAVAEANVRNVVFASSGGTVYGNGSVGPLTEEAALSPQCPYGVGKVLVEQCLRFFAAKTGTAVTVLRPSNPYGPGQSPLGRQGAIPIFMRKIAVGEEIALFGNPSRDFLYVEDLAEAFVLAIRGHHEGFRILNVGSGRTTELQQVVRLIEDTIGRRARVIRKGHREYDVDTNSLAIDRIGRSLAWSPRVSLAEGIARTWSWVQTVI